MNRKSISLHVIAKNEAANLATLFKSVEGCVDAIYLTDTGSTDDTVQIAKDLGAVVSEFKWINDFSAARNFNFSQGTEDFQLWLDCDDSLTNPEGFKLWRDNVMDLADYHYATYDYANDGKVAVCSFTRERVVRRSMGFKWQYFLHEGIMPESSVRAARMDNATQWRVWHRRNEEDLKADRMRNLAIFKGREMHMDARLTFYYGKELMEAGLPELAKHWLTKSLGMDIQAHDKTLAIQYLCYSNMIIANQQVEFMNTYREERYQKAANDLLGEAIDAGLRGIRHDPLRAEFYTIVGDCYVKLNGAAQAMPFYSAALRCKPSASSMAGAIFSSADLYSHYPKRKMTELLAQMGDIPGAMEAAESLHDSHPSEESQKIIDELKTIIDFNAVKKSGAGSTDIIMTCQAVGFFEWDGRSYREKFCGGSETAAVEMAENLAKLSGRKVIVFQPRESEFVYNNVIYRPLKNLHDYLVDVKPAVHIAWRHNVKLTDAFTILWCHDLVTQGAENHENYNFMACLTPFHKRYVMARQGIPDAKIWVTRNGLDPSKFEGLDNIEKDPNRFVFSSSPDRGLDRAMLVLDRVREEFPDVTLFVHYGIEHLARYGHGDMQAMLKKMMDERPWVSYVGKTNQTDLMQSFAKSAYAIQPSDFIETSCISALERSACGVYQIMRKVGGVVDTLQPIESEGMAQTIDSDCISPDQYQIYVDATKQAMREEAYKRVKVDAHKYAWETVAAEWLEFFESPPSNL